MADKKKILVAKIEEDQEPQDVTFKEWIKTKIDKAFTDNIPISSIKDMGGTYMYIGGMLAYCFFFGCFVYFVWTGYAQARSTKIISLQDDAENGECDNVFRQITGQWLASSNGLFSGDIAFKYPEAKYALEFQNFQGTIDKYREVMNNYRVELEALAAIAVTQDLADNILTWITWQILERDDGEVRRFQMIADATSVFNNEYVFGQISTVKYECYVSTSAPASTQQMDCYKMYTVIMISQATLTARLLILICLDTMNGFTVMCSWWDWMWLPPSLLSL